MSRIESGKRQEVEMTKKMWDLLHSATAYYPASPNEEEKEKMRTFLTSLPKVSKWSGSLEKWSLRFT